MLRAIFSDVHGNLEALDAVLADAASYHPDRYEFLGDLVGYGPDPRTCIDRIRSACRVTLCGNHDHATVHGTLGFSDEARASLEETRRLLEPGRLALPSTRKRWMFLRNLPHSIRHQDELLVHASPRDPLSEYLLPDDPIYRPEKLYEAFALVDRLAFVGHTHMPGLFLSEPRTRFLSQKELGEDSISMDSQKYIINVGSVGQPRDQDARACYVLMDGETIRFRRVPYEVDKTVSKILANPRLPDRNAERLTIGV